MRQPRDDLIAFSGAAGRIVARAPVAVYLRATAGGAGALRVSIKQSMLGEARNVRKPLMLHVAALDQFCPPEEQRKVQLGLSQDPQIDVLLYANVNHAFAREGGQHEDSEVAALANGRTLAFFRKNLA